MRVRRILCTVCRTGYGNELLALSDASCRRNALSLFQNALIGSLLTRYLFAKVIAALTSAFGVAFVGLTFTYLLLATQYNLTPQISEWNAGGTLVLEGHIVGYWLLQFAVRSLSLGCWVLLTLAVAAWTRNRYIAVLSPLLFGYMLDILVSLCAQIPVVGTGLYQWYCAYPYKYIASGDAPFFRAWDYLKAFMLAYAPYFVIFILADILVLRKRVKEHV